LGELYNFRMVDSSVVFDTLYLLINFGHERGRADPEKGSPLDTPDDFFRIRLVRSRYKVALAGSNATDAMLLVWHHWSRTLGMHLAGHVRQLLWQGQSQDHA